METVYWISGAVAVGLFIYLVVALMKPEIFS
ncbi:MAG TPA: K(+)-transporting ATPase subunit F [Dissulfurispiraceae bacterium]|nr:K(+)-transporting ATPase subunit F [Dissulfurispiraceae bacterium]